MSELKATLFWLVVAVLLIPVGMGIIRRVKRDPRAMAPLVGLLMLFGTLYPPDPPPPPATESVIPREDDEPVDPER